MEEGYTISLRPAVLEEAGAEGVGVEAPLVHPETAPLGAVTSLATLWATGWMTWVKVSLVLAASNSGFSAVSACCALSCQDWASLCNAEQWRNAAKRPGNLCCGT